MINFSQIIDNKGVKFKGEFHHSYHFRCTTCQLVKTNFPQTRLSIYFF